MAGVATTKTSSKGQVVIPEGIRKRLGLTPGSQFVVVGEKDTVILKAISTPTLADFDELASEARRQARKLDAIAYVASDPAHLLSPGWCS
ncbi:MAG: AbrB/MazE/SpoVT family DNA-binding domain-containing protein [Candidatus Methylomirabilis oxygeniifera]|uniref:SpoVT-AbrB domain-containing protein n=1 Tax=Methylomirabilis oxygeniifera TaxID=671143 RepID=D5MMT2_METO1|nr:MAG: AbrB/MazE/SpoVT family DNA-binding domain-containing protein [Candidatus Methylomirabilis oxyfera]CBE68032.1 protein of unknown function [Candidatus Methylomirabilis oxyfera]